MIADHAQARKAVPRDGEVPYRPIPADMLYLDRDGWDEMLSFGPLLAFYPVCQAGRRRRRRWRRQTRPGLCAVQQWTGWRRPRRHGV